MKALSLTQPFASLVANGAKRIETRSWRTSYRGELAIHAAKNFPKEARSLLDTFVFYGAFLPVMADYLKREGVRLVPMACAREVVHSLPLGAVIATCRLVECIRTEDIAGRRWLTPDDHPDFQRFELTEQELAFGDYSIHRWAWLLADIKPLPEPIPAKGALSLWEWNP